MSQQSGQMHVVMVTNVVAPDKLGGLERYVRELSAEIVRQGHLVTVVSKKTSELQPLQEEFADGVKVQRYDVPSKRDPLFAIKYPFFVATGVRRAIRAAMVQSDAGSTIVHGHFPLPMIYPLLRRMPYVYTCHAPVHKEILDERQESYRLPAIVQDAFIGTFKAVEKLIIRSAERVVTLSQFVCDEVVELTAKHPESITRIPGGLDTSWFSPDSRPETREPARGPWLFTARRLVSRTGVEELIRAMPLVQEQKPDARLTVAGDGPLRERLQGIIEELGLLETVQLVGRISDADLRDWYRRADIAVTPTRNLEGFGLSTVEAMACGAVPLVTPVAANPEVVGKLSSLLVAPGADAHGIADGVLKLWQAPAYTSLRASVRSEVHPRLGWPEVCRQYLDVYRDVSEIEADVPQRQAVASRTG
jgi:glycosyltransferase involved in cell wall biosynthesis